MGSRIARRLASLVAAAVAALALAGVASAENYVAMGDSYSAGNGANSTNLSSSCNRNTYAYPYLLAQQRGSALTFVACSGAVTGDIVNGQAAAANSSTNLVTLTIGGNDVGFASLIVACTTLGCQSQIDSSNSQIDNQLPAKLDAAYNAISSHAPNARVVVLGYGRPFAHKGCWGTTGVSLSEEDQLNSLTDHLNSVIKSRALAHGFSFADVTPYWIGHAVCTSDPFTNGLNLFSTGESYHPTRHGYANGDVPAVRAIIG
ncbi:MAG TPA: SGNH/GDSL hydrolase family protein [Baekduia sp.]|nr:SGNH/GDSL hydrolase family protein [Baekduia sp.]